MAGTASAYVTAAQDKQAALAASLPEKFTALETHYASDDRLADLKEKFKANILASVGALAGDTKLVLMLVDLQNDFAMRDSALYVEGGEDVILSNMALLDAVEELHAADPTLAEHLAIMTTQDTHRYGREMAHPEAVSMTAAYGDAEAEAAVAKEQKELAAFNPANEQYGLHCLVGTPGVAIAQPIEDRLALLAKIGITIVRIGKINFSAAVAGLAMVEGVDPASAEAAAMESLFAEPLLTTQACLEDLNAGRVIATGICANVCVEESACGLKECGFAAPVCVLDAATHFLVPPIPGVTLKTVHDTTAGHYAKLDIELVTVDGHGPNTGYLESAAAAPTMPFAAEAIVEGSGGGAATSEPPHHDPVG